MARGMKEGEHLCDGRDALGVLLQGGLAAPVDGRLVSVGRGCRQQLQAHKR